MVTCGPLGIELIRHFENLELEAYPDQGGVWTIGWGTTRVNGKPVVEGMRCTPEQAEEWFRADIAAFAKAITRSVRPTLPQHSIDALFSFTYNLGAGALQSSSLLRAINGGKPVAENLFTRWNKVRIKKVLTPVAGLTRRRKAEYHLYTTGQLKFYF